MGYRTAIIGYGSMGRRHAQAMSQVEEIDLVAVCDASEDARESARAEVPGITLYHDAVSMFDAEKLDVVAIPTEATPRAKLALLAADRGLHVVCEKPLAANLEEADAMVARFAERNLILAVNHQWRLQPTAARIAEMLGEGAIGTLTTMAVNFCKGRPAGYELAEMGTHVFDMVCKYAGAPTSCTAHILTGDRPADRDDIVRGDQLHPGGHDCGWVVGSAIGGAFSFDSGVVALIEGFGAPGRMVNERIRIDFRGTRGRMRLTGGSFDELSYAPGEYPEGPDHVIPWQSVMRSSRNDAGDGISWMAGTIVPVYRELARSIESGEPHPCSGETGRRSMEMIAAVFTAHFAGAPVAMPLADRSDPLAPR